MKTLLIFIMILFSNILIGQTLELEKKYINDMAFSGKWTQAEMQRIGPAWQNLMKEFGGFPDLPFNNETKKIEFKYIEEFKGISKQKLFRRIMEWIAINYGSIKSVLHYEDFESGKIIVKGYSNLIIDDIAENFWGNPKLKLSLQMSNMNQKLQDFFLTTIYIYQGVCSNIGCQNYTLSL